MNIVISGCGNIGFETLRQLVTRFPQANIAVFDINQPDYLLDFLSTSEAKNINFISADMTNAKSVEMAYLNTGFERIDVLISTIGVASEATAIDDFWNFKNDFEINYFANLLPIKQALGRMINGESKIVILLSSSAVQTPAKLTAYAPAKWALLNYGSSLRSEMVKKRIGVLLLAPGNIINSYSNSFTHKNGIEAADVAKKIVTFASQNTCSYKPKRTCYLPLRVFFVKIIERLIPDLQDWRFGLRSKCLRKKMFSSFIPNSALITGASKGLGKKLAYIYGKRLKELHLVARNTVELTELKRDIEQRTSCTVYIHTLDLADLHSVKDFVESVTNVDLIINNAGYAVVGEVGNISSDDYKRNLAVNFLAPSLIISEFMKKPIHPKKIINVLSTTTIAGRAHYSSYSSTKAALWALTRSFRRVYGNRIQILEVIVSSFADSGFNISFGSKRGKFMDSQFVARKIEKYEAAGCERLIMPLKSRLFLWFEALFPRTFQRVFP